MHHPRYRFYVYIVTNFHRTSLYTGLTNNLEQRILEHYRNNGKPDTFAGRNNCYFLLYYEHHQYILNAIQQEKYIKDLSRTKKNALISEMNPERKFLNAEIFDQWPPNDGQHRKEL